jgi:hypothetical protein
VFTVSSVVGSVISISVENNEALKKRYTPLIAWIDRIAFLIIAMTLIYYGSSYPLDITVWLLPVILLGLFYGLLLRILVPRLIKTKINYQKEEEEKKRCLKLQSTSLTRLPPRINIVTYVLGNKTLPGLAYFSLVTVVISVLPDAGYAIKEVMKIAVVVLGLFVAGLAFLSYKGSRVDGSSGYAGDHH